MEKESHELLPLTRQMASGSIRNKESRRPSGLHLNQSATAGRRECTGAKRGDRQNYAVLNRRSHVRTRIFGTVVIRRATAVKTDSCVEMILCDRIYARNYPTSTRGVARATGL